MQFITTSTFLFTLLTTAFAAKWECHASGGSGAEGLKDIHRTFNKLYGGSQLVIDSNQCYWAVCDGKAFGLCNNTGQIQVEGSNHRNVAARSDPKDGISCTMFVNGGFWMSDLYYVFEDPANVENANARRNDIRYC